MRRRKRRRKRRRRKRRKRRWSREDHTRVQLKKITHQSSQG